MSRLLLKHSVNTSLTQTLLRQIRSLTGQVATKEKPLQEQKESEKINQDTLQASEKLSNIYAKQRIKKPTRPPFLKNVFLGKFDTEILIYPEALDKEAVEKLEQETHGLKLYYENNEVPSKKEFWESAKQFKLLGLHAPQLANGRELNITESLKFYEVIAENSDDIQVLTSEQAVYALLKHGSDKQINKYVNDITSGKISLAWCISEEFGCDPKQFTTSAKFDANKKHWILNGKKLHVVNGDSADLFLVLVKTKLFTAGMNETDVSCLLVERNFGGVTSKSSQALGVNKSEIAEVVFENTFVPEENVLGKENRGLELYSKVLPEINLMNAIASYVITKNSYNKYLDYCKDVSKIGSNLLETELVAEKLSDFASRIYAMESMIYLTAGLLDVYDNQDCQIEGTITKIFSAEHSTNMTSHIMHLIGPDAYFTNHWANSNYRDAAHYLLFNGTPDSSKIIIALQGLQHAGVELQGLIKKIRNPLFHTKEVFTRMWTQRRNNSDNPKLTLQLRNYLHESTMSGAEWLEYSVLRLQYATELMLAHYGVEVVNKHTDLIRLADSVIDIYAMTAVLGRASRSYCIGLSHSECDIILASVFCMKAMQRVKQQVRLIQDGPYINNDVAHGKVTEKVCHVGRYFPEHPLARNF